MNTVFISHTYRDTDLASEFERVLINLGRKRGSFSGVRVLRTANLPPGVNWQNEIHKRLSSADAFVALITEGYLESQNAVLELGRLLERSEQNQTPLIPVVVEPLDFRDTPVSSYIGFKLPRILTERSSNRIYEACHSILEAIDRWRNERFPAGSGELYIDYKVMAPRTLASLLSALSSLYLHIYQLSAATRAHPSPEDVFEQAPADRLQISSIQTGESINLRVKTGWVPSFEVDDGKPVLAIPRGAVSLAATFAIFSVAIENGTSSIKNVLDVIKTSNEIRLQQIQEDKLLLEIESLRESLEKSSDKERDAMEQEIARMLDLTVLNADINTVRATANDSLRTQVPMDG